MSAQLILDQLASFGIAEAHLCNDSRAVKAGDVFIAFPGERVDGRNFISAAVKAGAAAVVWEQNNFSWPAELAVQNIAVTGLRALAGELASLAYGNPSEKLWVVGVTGTNGKTSCTQWIAQAMAKAGKPCAVIGTLGNGFPDAMDAGINTTPDPMLLHAMLAGYCGEGAAAAAIEASSHGMEQGRLAGVAFDCALFTNLTRDHLDYHGTMEAYAAAKRRLFDWPTLKHAVINLDDDFGMQVAAQLEGRNVVRIGYSLGRHSATRAWADEWLEADDIVLGVQNTRFAIRSSFGNATVETPLAGRHNVANLLGVLGALIAAGISFDEAVNLLGALKPIAGRLQRLGGDGNPTVFVDYAHTPDALEKTLTTLREMLNVDAARGGRLICIFGCGGDRDAGKRPLMGRIAAALADRVVVTSDNPRSEDPHKIIEQIIAGMQEEARGKHEIALDRAAGIHAGISNASKTDLILVAGKGHENYQEIKGTRIPFSDVDIAQDALARWAA